MPSKSRQAFDQNAEDIERLLGLHEQEGGTKKGRRFGLEVLNKSAIVLITAFWEAYCEDLAAEALEHIVKHAEDASSLSKELRKQIATEVKGDKNELAVWGLSGDGWRSVLRKRLKALQEERNRRLNTPKSHNIDEIFNRTLGLPKVSESWNWPTKMTAQRARKKMDKYVSLRGAIAHRGANGKTVRKAQVTDYFEFIKKVASKTGGRVNTHVKTITGKPLWNRNVVKRVRRGS